MVIKLRRSRVVLSGGWGGEGHWKTKAEAEVEAEVVGGMAVGEVKQQ